MNKMFFSYMGMNFPNYIQDGSAAKFIFPFALFFCRGRGLDVGGTQQCHFPGSTIVNVDTNSPWSAEHLPPGKFDYIFSSHTLEHLIDWEGCLAQWKLQLNPEGVLFLYLPHPDMPYWSPERCLKHRHAFTPSLIVATLSKIGFPVVLASGRDLYWSFSVVGLL